MTTPMLTTGDLECQVDGCEYVAIDDPVRWTKSPASRLAQHTKRSHGTDGDDAVIRALDLGPDEETTPEGPGPVDDIPSTEEIPPAPTDSPARSATVGEPVRRRGLRDRAKQAIGSRRKPKTDDTEAGPVTKERAPKPTRRAGKRLSAAELLGDFWGWGGRQMQRNGHVPTGRMLTWQSPVAGEILDDALAGTAVDRIALQRLVAARGTLDLIVAVAGPPVVVYQLERAIAGGAPPAVVEQLMAALKGIIRESLPTMLPAMKRARAKETKAQKDLVQLFDEDDLAALGVMVNDKGEPIDAAGHKVDVADLFVAQLFAEWQPVVVQPEPEGVPL